MKLVITECDHDAFDQEREVAARYHAELVIAQAHTPEEIVAAAADADGIIVQYATIDAALMDRLPKLRAIGRYGVGYDSIDVPAATTRGIAVFTVPDYGTESVSDHALALALAMLRDIPRLDRYLRCGRAGFPAVRPERLFATRTVGVLGCGLIGSALARKASALGMTVIVHDIAAGQAESFHGFPAVSFTELLRRSDVLSIHVPLTELTRGMINADALAQMSAQAIIVNTARGPIVDSEALRAALVAGHLRGAALDVLDVEPVPTDHPLMAMDNVTFTPHMGWYTEDSYGELKRRAVENVASFLVGEAPRNLLNPEALGVSSVRARS